MKLFLIANGTVYISIVIAMFIFMVANPTSTVKAVSAIAFVTMFAIIMGGFNLLVLMFQVI